jgi:hypothetical protein
MWHKGGMAMAGKTKLEKNRPSDNVPTTLLGLNGLETGPRHPSHGTHPENGHSSKLFTKF